MRVIAGSYPRITSHWYLIFSMPWTPSAEHSVSTNNIVIHSRTFSVLTRCNHYSLPVDAPHSTDSDGWWIGKEMNLVECMLKPVLTPGAGIKFYVPEQWRGCVEFPCIWSIECIAFHVLKSISVSSSVCLSI